MFKPVVGVVRGGPSTEYEVSLKTGGAVLSALPSSEYDCKDIFIDKEGQWHMRGMPIEPVRALDQVDVVFNALHGAYGEDGQLQHMLDAHGVPYTGTAALGSGIAMNKLLAKRQLAGTNMVFAAHEVLGEKYCGEEAMHEILGKLSPPLVVKPLTGGSSVATGIATNFDELLFAALFAFEHADKVLVEQFVRGKEVTVAVAEEFRGAELYAFPPVLIRPTKSGFFDYAEKYEGFAAEECPAPLDKDTTEQLLDAARTVHRTLGLRDYSRSDFILGSDGIYFLEVNTLPGLTETSLVPKAVAAVGATLPQFLDHVTSRALARA